MDRYRGLIVLGGPMNLDEQQRYPHLSTELALIEQALTQDKPVLGICLGSQLLAHVLGASIHRLPCQEIGWYSLRCPASAALDPVVAPLGEVSPVFQWHGCGFDLPADAEHLASTESWANQAFRYGKHAYGFQFHLEMDQPLIERWLSNEAYARELRESALAVSAEQIRQQTPALITAMRARADRVFNNFLDLIGRPARRWVLPSR